MNSFPVGIEEYHPKCNNVNDAVLLLQYHFTPRGGKS